MAAALTCPPPTFSMGIRVSCRSSTFFFFQAEDGIRDYKVTGVQTCALPIFGFYDGLIGPGTGTFLVLALTALLRLDLVTASATAKIVNCCTNAGALAMFS